MSSPIFAAQESRQPSDIDFDLVRKETARLLVSLLYVAMILQIDFPSRPVVASIVSVLFSLVFLTLWYWQLTWLKLITLTAVPLLIFGLAQVGSMLVTKTAPPNNDSSEIVTVDSDDAAEAAAGARNPLALGDGQLPGQVPIQTTLVAQKQLPFAGGKKQAPTGPDTLIILVHGAGGPEYMRQIRDMLLEKDVQQADWSKLDEPRKGNDKPQSSVGADVLSLRYKHSWLDFLSNADPEFIAKGIHDRIREKFRTRSYQRIVLVGHSMGALLVRKAFLIGLEEAQSAAKNDGPAQGAQAPPWTDKVRRFVLLAGMNRGWSLSGPRPLDMGTGTYLRLWTLSAFWRLTGTGQLPLNTMSGAPFVANLRLEWMRQSRSNDRPLPPTVQLLGDIDDIVCEADNMDLRVTGGAAFCWMRVRGTGHGEIVDISSDKADQDEKKLRDYRRHKVQRAVTEQFDRLQTDNDVQPYQTDRSVRGLVFVLHGIRDLGRWSAEFEEALTKSLPEGANIRIVSPRYGYFGMGPFVLPAQREKHVRWFMDAYTEALAQYPSATQINFFGHSNGTYLLAEGLEKYRELKVNRIVFAGSVVRRGYDWNGRFKQKQVNAVRNYVASGDWVVALFPCFFEQWPARLLENKLGSAGFNGFNQPGGVPGAAVFGKPLTGGDPITKTGADIADVQGTRVSLIPHDPSNTKETFDNASFVQNVGRINGQHSAFDTETHVRSIVEFLSQRDGPPCLVIPNDVGLLHGVLGVFSYFCILVWVILVAVVLGLGYIVIKPAGAWKCLLPLTTFKRPPVQWSAKAVCLWALSPLLILFHAAVWLLCLLAGLWAPVVSGVWVPLRVIGYVGFILWLLHTI